MLEFLACLDKTLLKHLLGSGGRSIASTIARHERGNHQLSRSALISFIAALSNAVTLRRCGNYLGRGDHAWRRSCYPSARPSPSRRASGSAKHRPAKRYPVTDEMRNELWPARERKLNGEFLDDGDWQQMIDQARAVNDPMLAALLKSP
jgi:hypothetical protein